MNNQTNKVLKKTAKVTLSKQIGIKAQRKVKARHHRGDTMWFGLGMMGLIGWSVAIPTLLGTVLGIWLDKHYSGERSWTLALLLAGLIFGCFTAWSWVNKEDKAMGECNKEEHQDD
ncbi:MAG: ATP synthase protein I [Paraglaciecola sp.]|jgi:ATP synthase protein I